MNLRIIVLKRLLHFAAVLGLLLPFLLGGFGLLGPDPAAAIIDASGQIAIYLLAFTLLMPLIKRWFSSILLYRRIIGIYSFVFASQHLLWVVLYELGLDLGFLLELTVEKPFIWLGMLAWLLLLPLAVTSLTSLQKKMRKRWKQLHQVVYLVALFAGFHYFWQLRDELTTAILIGVTLASIYIHKLWRVLGKSP